MFVMNYPAMKIGKNLIIGDLHIGIIHELKGIYFSGMGKRLADKANKIKDRTKTKNLIILGDVKHSLGLKKAETKEIEEFFEELDFENLSITKGNHDGVLEKVVEAEIVNYVLLKNYLFIHGNQKLPKEKFKQVVIGHNHPAVRIRDKMGMSYIEPVWCRSYAEETKIILMPAFNEISGKTILNEKGAELLGPVAKKMNLPDAEVFLLDSTKLGKVSDMYGV